MYVISVKQIMIELSTIGTHTHTHSQQLIEVVGNNIESSSVFASIIEIAITEKKKKKKKSVT